MKKTTLNKIRHQAVILADILEKDSLSKDYKDTLKEIYDEKLKRANELYRLEDTNNDNPSI